MPNHKNEFIYTASAVTEIHTDLPMQTYQNMQGLDEPNEFNLAYGVNFGNTYMGFTTVQPAGGYSNDYDIYKFLAQGNGNLTFTEKAKEYNLNNQGYSTHAAFFDYDADGDLDCYILNNSFRNPDKIELYKKSMSVILEDILNLIIYFK